MVNTGILIGGYSCNIMTDTGCWYHIGSNESDKIRLDSKYNLKTELSIADRFKDYRKVFGPRNRM